MLIKALAMSCLWPCPCPCTDTLTLGSVGALTGHPYGAMRLLKVGLVGVAVLMGGCNRVFVMPSLLDNLRRNHPAAAAQVRRFTLIVRLEMVVLLGVLILATCVSSTSPPGAA